MASNSNTDPTPTPSLADTDTDTDTDTSTLTGTGTGTGSEWSRAALQRPNTVQMTKLSGYMDKRSKLWGWKQYWFVLDGRLLTYYKSQAHYERLAACIGSINLGIATHVSPLQPASTSGSVISLQALQSSSNNNNNLKLNAKGFTFQIVTKTQLYYLRCRERRDLDAWLLAIQHTVAVPSRISSHNSVSSWALNLDDCVGPGWDHARVKSNKSHRYAQHQHSSSLLGSKTKITAQSEWALNLNCDWNETEELRRNNLTTSTVKSQTPLTKKPALLKKYHSLTSLNFSPFTLSKSKSSLYDQPFGFGVSQQNQVQSQNQHPNPNPTLHSPREMQELGDAAPMRNKNNLNKVRNASSLLILNSSPKFTQLSRKMSVPSSPGSDSPSNSGLSTLRNLSRHPSYQNTGTGSDATSPLDLNNGIYEPCGREYPKQKESKNGQLHLEWEGALVNKVRTLTSTSTSTSTSTPNTKPTPTPSDSIYESLDDQSESDFGDSPKPNLEQSQQLPNPASTLDQAPPAKNKPQPLRQRYSLQSHKSLGGTSVHSLQSIDEEFHECSTSTMHPLPNSSHHDEGTTKELDAAAKRGKFKSSKSNGKIAGFFQTIFSKSSKKKGGKGDPTAISSPVHLRPSSELTHPQQMTESEETSTENLKDKKEEKQNGVEKHPSIEEQEEVEERRNERETERMTSSRERLKGLGLKPAVGSAFTSTENLMAELNKKMEQRQLNKSKSEGAQFQDQPKIPVKKSMSHADPLQSNCHTSREEPSETYQDKLAKFNKMTPPPATPSLPLQQGQSVPSLLTRKHSAPSSIIGRSQSLSYRQSVQVAPPPTLPPKRKPTPRIPLYDVPKNNSPVLQSIVKSASEERLQLTTHKSASASAQSPQITFLSHPTNNPSNGCQQPKFVTEIAHEGIQFQPAQGIMSSPLPGGEVYVKYNNSSQNEKQREVCSESEEQESDGVRASRNSQPPKPPPRPTKTLKRSQCSLHENGNAENTQKGLAMKLSSDLDLNAKDSADAVAPLENTSTFPHTPLPLEESAEGCEMEIQRPRLHRIQSQTYDDVAEEKEGHVISSAQVLIEDQTKWGGGKISESLPLSQDTPSPVPVFAQLIQVPPMETIVRSTQTTKRSRKSMAPQPPSTSAPVPAAQSHPPEEISSGKEAKSPPDLYPSTPGSTSGDSGVGGDAEEGNVDTENELVSSSSKAQELEHDHEEELEDGSHFYDDVPLELDLVVEEMKEDLDDEIYEVYL